MWNPLWVLACDHLPDQKDCSCVVQTWIHISTFLFAATLGCKHFDAACVVPVHDPVFPSRCWLNFLLFPLAVPLDGLGRGHGSCGRLSPSCTAQFNCDFGSEEVIPVEKFFKAFGLENLSIDPNQVILPLKVPMDLPLEPTVEQYWQFRAGWETPFDEDHQYRMLLPELMYSRGLGALPPCLSIQNCLFFWTWQGRRS